jgi:hypothetical protein
MRLDGMRKTTSGSKVVRFVHTHFAAFACNTSTA